MYYPYYPYLLQITPVSLMNGLAAVAFMIFIFHKIVSSKHLYPKYRIDFLGLMLFLILLRLLLPWELFITKTIRCQNFLWTIYEFLQRPFIAGASILNLFALIWAAGILVLSIKHIKDIYVLKKTSQQIKEKGRIFCLSDFISESCFKNYRIVESPLVKRPMVQGFDNCIYVPQGFHKQDIIYSVLIHEAVHLKQKHLYFKELISLLTIVFWWFYPIYILEKDFELFIEMKTDISVSKLLKSEEYFSYAEDLVREAKKENDKQASKKLSIAFNNSSQLYYRINYYLENQNHPKTQKFFLYLFSALILSTWLFIFEPIPNYERNLPANVGTADEYYILIYEDGTCQDIIRDNPMPRYKPSEKEIQKMLQWNYPLTVIRVKDLKEPA